MGTISINWFARPVLHVTDVAAALSFRFATSAKTDDDRTRAINDAMFQAASWSLGALMQEHAPLIAVCERIFETATLSANERISLAIALQKAAPDVWDVKIDPAAGSAVVNRRRR